MDTKSLAEPNSDASPGLYARHFASGTCENDLPRCYIRRRRLLAFGGGLGLFTLYMQRVCMSVAAEETTTGVSQQPPTMVSEFHWSNSQQGMLVGGFCGGYTLSQFPAALTVERIGGTRVFLAVLLTSSILTILTPLAAAHSFGFALLCRILVGLCQGPVYPAFVALLAAWAPPLERTGLLGVSFSGSYLGTIVGFFLSTVLLTFFGWRAVFYCIGCLGMVCAIIWPFLASDSPTSDSRAHAAEVAFIRQSQGQQVDSDVRPRSWQTVLHHALQARCFRSVIVMGFWNGFGFYVLLGELPSFLHTVLAISEENSGFIATMPYLLLWGVLIVAGACSDMLIRSGIMSVIHVRKLCGFLAMMPPGALLVAAGYSPQPLALSFIFVAVGCSGLIECSFSANILDIGGENSGLLMSLANSAAQVGGIFGPYIVGCLTQQLGYVQGYRLAFVMCLVCYWIGAAAFLVSGSAKPLIVPVSRRSIC